MLKKTLTIALLSATLLSAGACSTEESTNLDYTVSDSYLYVCSTETIDGAAPIWDCETNN